MFAQSIIIATETHGEYTEYITRNWQKIKLHFFPDYFNKIIKLTGFI